MSQARVNFLNRHAALAACLADAIVQDGTPADHQKNIMAAMFRNGLAVLAFSMMEAFVRERTAEILQSFSNMSVRFTDLSDKLQTAVTLNAIKAVTFRASLKEKIDQIPWALAQLPIISASPTNVSTLSEFAFGHTKSNISHEDLTEVLGAFGVEGGWNAISQIAKRIGLGGVPDYSQAFKDIAKRRHAAAHDATARIPINDLNDTAVAIMAICCSFDLLLSHSLGIHNSGQVPNKTNGLISASQIGIRFLAHHPSRIGIFSEQIEKSTRMHTVRTYASLQAAEQACIAKCSANRQQLVHLGSNQTPERWRTW